MTAHTIDFTAMMTENVQIEAYDIFGVMKRKRVLCARDRHAMILKKHPQNHFASRFKADSFAAMAKQ